MDETRFQFQAAKVADLAGTHAQFRAELVRRLQDMDRPTTYSGETGDRIAALSSFMSRSVAHYVVSCGQVMTYDQAVYCGRIRPDGVVSPSTGKEG